MAIKIYAIIQDEVVVNVTAANTSFAKKRSDFVDIETSDIEGVSIGWAYKKGKFSPPERNFDLEWIEIRKERKRLLDESDWVVIRAKETGSNVPSSWKNYRQQLRDITKTFSNPDDVIFPELPE
jgi:hypothetical protein